MEYESASSVATSQELPFIDEHCVTIAASAEATWSGLRSVPAGFEGRGKGLFARALGCADVAVTAADPLQVGSTCPGFHVTEASAPATLFLEGRHKFSRYALNFRVERTSATESRLCAETRAEFPGIHGKLYRSLVIGTRLHVVVVRDILRMVKRRAERPSA
ncbi:MAG TPA: hypothetical protein VG929_08830 [Actinomycetota bacterium]|nr:hypothetical protein [Actinomycetota bacterium]